MSKNVIDVLEEIESTSGTNAKLAVVESNKNVPFLRDFFRLCEDSTIDFGVRKIPGVQSKSRSDEGIVSSYLSILENNLATRYVTGNSAKLQVTTALSYMDETTQKWCIRLLLRNLRCGVSGKLVERVWPGLVVPYKVLLATAVPVDDENVPVGVKFPIRGEPKLDGLRCIAEKRDGVVTLKTRNGNVIDTLPKIKAAFEKIDADNVVFDGEGMVSRTDDESWNDSASTIMSHKNKKDDTEMTYNMFDCVSVDDWDKKLCRFPLVTRASNCAEIASTVPAGSPIKHVEGRILNDMTELLAFYDECLERGYEGIMLKDLTGMYEWKRVKTSVMKYKPVGTYDGVIVGWYKGGVGTKNADSFGGFNVLLTNGIVTRVGGGFKDEMRKKFSVDADEYIGEAVEIEGAKGLAKNGKIRFPEFKRFRIAEDVDPVVFEALVKWAEENR